MAILCEHCGGEVERVGSVSFPTQFIYRCFTCKRHTWVRPGARKHSAVTPHVRQEQPQQAQQQQKKTEED